MTKSLSISRAWDETKARLAADGKLFASVALALVALPGVVTELVSPNAGLGGQSGLLSIGILFAIASLIALVGQLALIRLAIGPSITVGGAINHGFRRAPVYFAAVLLIALGLVALAIPFVGVLSALGVTFEPGSSPPPISAYLVLIAGILLLIFVSVRMMMASPVASAERAGPVEIIKRSWRLTEGHSARLIGFLLLFILAAGITLGAVTLATEAIARIVLGPVEPLSVSALVVALVTALCNAIATTLFIVMVTRMYVQLTGEGGAEVTVPTSGS